MLSAWGISTAEQLVQTLKQPGDVVKPPSGRHDGVVKIDVLQHAWSDQELYVLQKAELLLDCSLEIMTRSLKAKGSQGRVRPYLDPMYWTLVSELLDAVDPDAVVRALVNKYNMFQIAGALFQECCEPATWKAAAKPLCVLLVASIRRSGAAHIELVNACLHDLIRAIPRICDAERLECTCFALASLLEPWKVSLGLGQNVKKSAKNFIDEGLEPFATALMHLDAVADSHPQQVEQARELLSQQPRMCLFAPSAAQWPKELPEILDNLAERLTQLLELSQERASETMLAAPELLAQALMCTGRGRDDELLDPAAPRRAPPTAVRHAILEHFLVPVFTAWHDIPAKRLEKRAKEVQALSRARMALVRQIEMSALYVRGGEHDATWSVLLNHLRNDTLAQVRTFPAATDLAACFETLRMLWILDADQFEPHLGDVLLETVHVGFEHDILVSMQKFIFQVIDTFGHLRRLPQLLEVLCRTLTQFCAERAKEPESMFSGISTSPMLCASTIEHLEWTLCNHTAAPQASLLLETVYKAAAEHLSAYAQSGTARNRSLREAAKLVCIGHLLGVCIRSVAVSSSDDTPEDVRTVLQESQKLADTSIRHGLSNKSRTSQRVIAFGLRLQYSLLRPRLGLWQIEALASLDVVPEHLEALTIMLSDDHCLAETRVEIVRAILSSAEMHALTEGSQVDRFRQLLTQDRLGRVLESMLTSGLRSTSKVQSYWDGQIFGLDAAFAPVALWRLLTVRWVSVLDWLSEESLLKGLVQYLQSSTDVAHDPTTPQQMLSELSHLALRNADFLEQPRWRSALMGHIAHAMAWIPTEKSPKEYSRRDLDEADLHQVMSLVRLVSGLPVEYIGRNGAGAIVPKLLWVDTWLMFQGKPGSATLSQWVALKTFLRRMLGAYPHTAAAFTPLTEYVRAVTKLDADGAGPDTQTQFADATCALLDTALSTSETRDPVLADDELASSLQACANAAPGSLSGQTAQYTLTLFICRAARIHASGRSDWAVAQAKPALIKEELHRGLSPLVDHTWREGTTGPVVPSRLEAVAALLSLAAARDRLDDAEQVFAQVVQASSIFCQEIGSEQQTPPFATSFCLGLLRCMAAVRAILPEASVRASLALCALYGTLTQVLPADAMDQSLLPTLLSNVAAMDPSEYASVLHGLVAAFSGDARSKQQALQTPSLLNVLGLLLQHGPQGTGRAASDCFSALLTRLPLVVEDDAGMIPTVLEALERVCAGRALLLRSHDVPRIFSILGSVLEPRAYSASWNGAAPRMFQGVVGTLSALVRLRKDLLGPYLPLLTEVLQQLLPLLSSLLRPNTGRAQLRRLDASTPCWLNVSVQPLGVAEANALSRLLAELGAKRTTVATAAAVSSRKRMRISADGASGSTESLARPMAKHAIYILVAYVRCVTQSITTIAKPLRQELQPGLLVLFELVGEHERSAALKGMLDASGQVIFKALWSDWERQRYKGA